MSVEALLIAGVLAGVGESHAADSSADLSLAIEAELTGDCDLRLTLRNTGERPIGVPAGLSFGPRAGLMLNLRAPDGAEFTTFGLSYDGYLGPASFDRPVMIAPGHAHLVEGPFPTPPAGSDMEAAFRRALGAESKFVVFYDVPAEVVGADRSIVAVPAGAPPIRSQPVTVGQRCADFVSRSRGE